MKLTINGEDLSLELPLATLPALLKNLELDKRPVVVEHNGNALLPREHDSVELKDGDQLEIVQVVAGG